MELSVPPVAEDIGRDTLAQIITYSKYSRYLPELNRRETWTEIVDRVVAMHKKKFPTLIEEIDRAFEFVYAKKVLPSLRSLQFAGKPIERANNRLFNCAFIPIDSWEAFHELMFLLLGGTGVAYSVQENHIDLLPAVTKPTRTKRYLIQDSIIGWADAVKAVMGAYLLGKAKPIFDFSDIREKGLPLKTSGGIAPGPEPLKDCLHNLQRILDRKESGERLTSLEVHTMCCFIADCVLAGGIRRAAMLALFNLDDESMLTCKFDKWYELNPELARANNSVTILRHRVKEKDFFELWDKIKASNSGEPGIFFTNDQNTMGTNPCGEAALKSFSFCVAGDTNLITKNGITKISESVDQLIEIWNGNEWSEVRPYQTGEQDDLYRVSFGDGSYLDATKDHKFLVKKSYHKDFQEKTTLELIKTWPGPSPREKWEIPRSKINYNCEGISETNAYEYGFFLGDGTLAQGKYTYASLYNDDKDLDFKNTVNIGKSLINSYGTEYQTVHFQNLDQVFATNLKNNVGLPRDIFGWNRESIINFISGWLDADGTNASKGVRLYGKHDKLQDAQLLLTKCGIDSSLNLMSKKGFKTNLGVRKNDVWYLQITVTAELKSQRLDCWNTDSPQWKGKYQTIRSIEKLPGKHKSYCLTEPKLHQCVFNNVLTKQCNLTTINAASVHGQEDLNQRATAAAFIGTLQASYTNFHYLREVWKVATEKDSLLGVSMTGIASGQVLKLDIAEAADCVIKENERVSKLIGINKAARCNLLKPEGTASLLLGTSSGIHAWHSRYYVRRLRLNKMEPIYKYLLAKIPELIEDDYFKPTTDAIVSIPLQAPKSAITRDEAALDLLNRVSLFHTKWILPGHRRGSNKHSVSCTVTVKPSEWEEVGQWMWENKNDYASISVLPFDYGTYQQPPFQEVDKETYERLNTFLQKIDLTEIRETNDQTTRQSEPACQAGACEVVFTS